tara:strand:- start:5317 stop:6483 length:1167 start_codon:yes stop_codon:yes gene_type:complete
MSKISLKHSGGNVVSLNSPTNAPAAADVAFKLPNADGANGQAIVTDGSGNLSFSSVAATRNLIINGAMQVAQYGTSSTDDGYNTCDRFRYDKTGTDENPTQEQVDVASGTTPYTSGFRKAFKITNGNQTSGAGAADRVVILHRVEAQDLANSGWNYTSASSYITLSYWVKSSVAQNFYVTLKTGDGTPQKYATETGSLTADTWTKITKTIPGASNVQIDNDNGEGLEIEWSLFRGTDQTGSMSLNAWAANNNSVRTPDQTSTWYTTNDATFEITGVQLEVGSVATDFEHLSYADELRLCCRYFQHLGRDDKLVYVTQTLGNYNPATFLVFPVEMRAAPTTTINQTTNNNGTISTSDLSPRNAAINIARSGSSAAFQQAEFDIQFSAEL